MLISYMRTVILYLLLILVVRVMGKRQIGQKWSRRNLSSRCCWPIWPPVPMQDNGISLASGLVPMLTVLGISLISPCWLTRASVCGVCSAVKPVISSTNGTICQRNLADADPSGRADRAPAGARAFWT